MGKDKEKYAETSIGSNSIVHKEFVHHCRHCGSKTTITIPMEINIKDPNKCAELIISKQRQYIKVLTALNENLETKLFIRLSKKH